MSFKPYSYRAFIFIKQMSRNMDNVSHILAHLLYKNCLKKEIYFIN